MNGTYKHEMSEHYRNIRKSVYEEATRPYLNNSEIHKANKGKIKQKIQQICAEANLELYKGSNKETAIAIWHHLWTKNRYAGIRAQIASTEIRDIEEIFDDYEIFSDPSWDIEAIGNRLLMAGEQVYNFINRQGMFHNKQTIGNIPKLKKIVSIARQLKKFMNYKTADTPVINFIKNKYVEEDVWAIHNHLIDIGYRADLTALHFMMDIGFQVVKPDIVLTKLFLDWGWLHKKLPNLPKDLSLEDLKGQGKYGQRFIYTNRKMYKPIIELSREIVSVTRKEDLRKDIGWVTDNPIREFDIFIVKYGQKPEDGWGIVRTLYETDVSSSYCITKDT
jgi:hypothetical protein